MSLNIDDMIRAGDVEIQHRVRRYDINWGRPHFAVTYKRLMLAKMPILYCAMEQTDYGAATYYTRNWGSLGRAHDLVFNPSSGTGMEWGSGQPDPTDNAVDFKGVGYAQSAVATANASLSMGYSIVMWFKPNAVLADGAVNGLICKQTNYGATTGSVCSIHLEGNAGANRLAVWLNNNNVFYTDPADIIFETGKWYCIVLTCTPGGALTDPLKHLSEDNPRLWVNNNPMVLYVNGVVVNIVNDKYNAPDFVTNNCKWLVGATRHSGAVVYKFNGHMDEVGVFPHAFNEQTIKQIYGLGLGATYLEPDEDFDNDVVGSYADQRKYPQLIIDDSPTNYWKMDTVLSGGGDDYKYIADSITGLYTRTLSIARNSGQWNANRIVTSPILDSNYVLPDVGKALEFSGDDYPGYIRNYNQWVATREQTVEFWFKKRGNSSHQDGIIGLTGWGSGRGFSLSTKNDRDWGVVIFAYFNDSTHVLRTDGNIALNQDTWYHVVATLSKYGEGRLYIDGVAVDAQSWGSDGWYHESYVSDLYIGGWGTDPNNTQPIFNMDDVALYSKALTANQVYNHYWTGKIGPYAKVQLNGGDPLQEPSPYLIGTNEYTELVNEEDITAYVETYTFDDDLKQLVPTASMTVFEDWGAAQINSKLNANTYVIIERRFLSQSLNYDSDWVSLGHFLVEGPIGSSFSAAGSRVSNVALKGLTKLFSLDLAHTPIEPDKLLVRKRKLNVTTSTVEYTKFHMSRYLDDPDPAHVFQNWAEFPSAKLWVTDFKAYDATDSSNGGISDPKEVIRIKGTEGAVRMLGGEGAVTIDNTYLLDKVSDNGLGDPSTIMAEFYRYATVEDKVVTTIASMAVVRNRWRIGLTKQEALIDGKTVMVKTGRAKGKLWKLVSIGSDRSLSGSKTIISTTTLTNTGTGTDWTKVSTYSGAPPPPGGGVQYAAQALDSTGLGSTTKVLEIPLTYSVPSSSTDWNDASKITGLVVKVWRRSRLSTGGILGYGGWAGNTDGVLDHSMQLRMGTLLTTSVSKTEAWPTDSTAWTSVTYGGTEQTLGTVWNWGQIKSLLTNAAFQFSVVLPRTHKVTDKAVAEVYQVTVEMTIEDLGVVTLFDIHGYPVNPEFEGLEVNDTVQVGDYNAVEDGVRKAAYRVGFQENDSTKPFYFELNPTPTDLAPSLPPVRPKISDQSYWAELISEMLQYAPPNYRLSVNNEGVLRGKLIGFLNGGVPTHTLIGRLDMNEDHGDYGIATRLIIEGEASDSFNIALNLNAGGTSSVKAYVLEGYIDGSLAPEKDNSLGITVDQATADSIWQQVFNGNPKTPVPNSSNAWKTRYGVILGQEGSPANVKRWKYEDTPLCAIDVGRSSTGTPIEIDALELTWINHYLEGNTISQSLIIHYMTEAAYEAEFGEALPSLPVQDDMSYFPPATSRAWTLLVDEFALQDGTTTVESSDFEGGLPIGVRFLKFTCGQAHYRFPIPAAETGDHDASVRVSLAECRIWTSKRIIATAELGVSGIFGTGDYKELATRLRRRTDYLEKNLYLNDYDKAKSFALAELQERYVDFTPIAVTCFAPTVQVGEIVYLVHPETGVGKTYLVVAASQDMSGVGKFQVLNYDIN